MRRLRQSVNEYLNQDNLDGWLGVTFTMKQRVNGKQLDEIACSRNFRHFLNLFNKKVYGNASVRYGKKVEVIPVLEKSLSGRLHYHTLIKNPLPEKVFQVEMMMKDIWQKTEWGYREVDVIRKIDNGWIGYITKHFGNETVDWENLNVAC